MKNTTNFIFRIDPQTKRDLENLAQMTGKSQAKVMRELINQAIQAPRAPQPPMVKVA